MLIKTILNRIQKHAYFVYGTCRFVEETGRPIIEVEIKARANSQPICSGCGKRRPGYGTLPSRRFEFVPLWGLAHRNLDGITAIGIDEIAWKKEPKFATLVYQVDNGTKRLLWIGRDRTAKTLLGFFAWFGKDRSNALRFVCSDMWKPYLRIVAQKACKALNVLDRFHIAKHMNISIDKIRAEEARELKAKGKEPILTHSRLKPMKKVAKMLRSHRELLLNWFRAKGRITLGTVQGLNNKVKVTTKRSYGFRSFDLLEIALYQAVGDLPEPKFSHKFC